SSATEWYATPNGAGTMDGSRWCNALPQTAIGGKLASMPPGDGLHLSSGTYNVSNNPIDITTSGSADNPKRLTGENTGGGMPILDGSWSPDAPDAGTQYAIRL